eukprot:1347499-Amorphochlora_amoeboformis.AAC.2
MSTVFQSMAFVQRQLRQLTVPRSQYRDNMGALPFVQASGASSSATISRNSRSTFTRIKSSDCFALKPQTWRNMPRPVWSSKTERKGSYVILMTRFADEGKVDGLALDKCR